MKKYILLILLSFIICPIFIKAECSYKDIVELNKMASYVTSSYTFDENTNTFNLKLLNVNSNIMVNYLNVPYYQVDGEVNIYSIPEGTRMNIKIVSINSGECDNRNLRNIVINIPYTNPYYNHHECNGKNVTMCTSKFLSYKPTYEMLESALNKYAKDNIKEEKTTEEVVEKTFYQKYEEFTFKYGKYIAIFLISIVGSYSIGKNILRKTVHGI